MADRRRTVLLGLLFGALAGAASAFILLAPPGRMNGLAILLGLAAVVTAAFLFMPRRPTGRTGARLPHGGGQR